MENRDALIDIAGVWKIFGDQQYEAMSVFKSDGLSKAEVLERLKCVVDAAFKVERGEIFCIMGLSGSGKSTLVATCQPIAGAHSRKNHGERPGHHGAWRSGAAQGPQ